MTRSLTSSPVTERRPWPAAALALAAALLLLGAFGAARAEPPCVPGSIGPSGCASIRPLDERTERPGVEKAPDLELEERTRRLVERYGRLEGPGVLRTGPDVSRAPMSGRDPGAVQSFQTPYSFE